MWEIKHINAQNIVSFEDLNLDINNNVATAIIGENKDDQSQKVNGSGKSALIECIAIGITGYAGLTGGNSKVPNGTVWICAINGNNGNQALRELHVNEERKRNLEICVEEAVKLALEVI